MVYSWVDAAQTTHLTYKNSAGAKYDLPGTGTDDYNASIAVDSKDGLHVMYRNAGRSINYTATPKLFVTIPGINDHGKKMVSRAVKIFRYDLASFRQIREIDGLTNNQIQQRVHKATRVAKEKGKDVIINIDMDLENYSIPTEYANQKARWQRSVRWASMVADIISQAFRDENQLGPRILYAHSAGGDAVNSSIKQKLGIQMWESINIFNGRTLASTFSDRLNKSGFKWWQVKVFTNFLDLPAMMKIPWVPESGSLSNYNVVGRAAGKSWVRLYGYGFMHSGHSGLRNCIGMKHPFKVYVGPSLGQWKDGNHTVEDMMFMDWRKEKTRRQRQ